MSLQRIRPRSGRQRAVVFDSSARHTNQQPGGMETFAVKAFRCRSGCGQYSRWKPLYPLETVRTFHVPDHDLSWAPHQSVSSAYRCRRTGASSYCRDEM